MFLLFENYTVILQGLIVGFIFGFLLQKGRVSRFNVIVGQLMLKDFTMLKIILSAIVVGSIGFHFFLDGDSQAPCGVFSQRRSEFASCVHHLA